MPTLNWIGKQAVEKHHLEIPYRLLEYDETLSVGDKESGNLLVQGDNLHALKALLPYYAGKVKCIYIDPPYNTGNEGWQYNDNVNAPEIKAWLNKVVGSEGEDLSRHDKWLCMMYPRLQLLKKLLSKDGAIFISIDENEFANLKLICDEIFSIQNYVGTFVWKSRSGKGGTANQIATLHEYVQCYAKNKTNLEIKTDRRIGKLRKEQLRQWGQGDKREDRPTMFYPIYTPEGNEVLPIRNDGTEGRWRVSKKTMQKLIDNKLVKFIEIDGRIQAYRIYEEGNVTETAIDSLLLNHGTASTGTVELKQIFSDKVFETTKPTELIKYFVSLITENDKTALVLDSFAGSGTTGHAVMELNKEDGGNRKFILVELEENIAKEVTSERLKRVINGYTVQKPNRSNEEIKGLGGGFRYCKLGEPLFDKFGNVRHGIKFKELARHIFFSENGVPLSEKAKLNTPLIGTYKGVAYYLLFNGILGDKTVNGGNVLTSKILESLPKHNGPKVIFGESNRLSAARLKKENIVFKQIPYEIRTS